MLLLNKVVLIPLILRGRLKAKAEADWWDARCEEEKAKARFPVEAGNVKWGMAIFWGFVQSAGVRHKFGGFLRKDQNGLIESTTIVNYLISFIYCIYL